MGIALISMTELIDHEVHYGAKEVDILGLWREVLRNYLFLPLKGKYLGDVSLLTNGMQNLSLLPSLPSLSLSLPFSCGFK